MSSLNTDTNSESNQLEQESPVVVEGGLGVFSGNLAQVLADRVKKAEEQQARFQRTVEATSRLDRQPFREELANFLNASPTPDAIRRFAEKSPDRWANAISALARAAGYADNNIAIKAEQNIYLQIQGKSDAELMVWLENTFYALGLEPPAELLAAIDPRKIINVTPKKESSKKD